MGYLTLRDYSQYITGDYLRQLVQGDLSKRVSEENVSVQDIAQKLTQKYDLDLEFTDTLPYDKTKTYPAAARVTVDISSNGFQLWVASTGYSVGDLVIQDSMGYACKADNSDATFTIANWTAVAPQFTIFYAVYPDTCTLNGQPNAATLMDPYAPVFSYKKLYSRGDTVIWKNYTYDCAQASTVISHQAALQYTEQEALPYNNIFPDNPIANAQGAYWANKTAYNIPAGTPLSDARWVQGDNRNQTIKDAMVRITVFKLSPLLAPRNRPEIWKEDFISIMSDLNCAARGEITMLLPLKQPRQGYRTAWGGEVKRVNNM